MDERRTQYRTSDLGLAAYLKCRGFIFVGVAEGNEATRKLFQFELPKDTENTKLDFDLARRDYYNKAKDTSAMDFHSAVKELRRHLSSFISGETVKDRDK